MDGVRIPELLEAVMKLSPLDTFVSDPVTLMRNLPEEPVPAIWETYRSILKIGAPDGAFTDFAFVDRIPFYEAVERAYAVVVEEVAKMALLMRQVKADAAIVPQHIQDKHFLRKHGPALLRTEVKRKDDRRVNCGKKAGFGHQD